MADFFFDFISPYSYLASTRIRADHPDLPLVYRPVILGSIFSALGVTAPGAIPSRRRIGLQDALLLAQHYGVPFEGPPRHPFNPIYALRSVCAVDDPSTRAALTHRYFDAAWAEGRALDDMEVLKACLQDVDVEQEPEDAATTREWRVALKGNTKAALAAAAWGVPTFVHGGVSLFGHDRLALLASLIEGSVVPATERLEEMLSRP